MDIDYKSLIEIVEFEAVVEVGLQPQLVLQFCLDLHQENSLVDVHPPGLGRAFK